MLRAILALVAISFSSITASSDALAQGRSPIPLKSVAGSHVMTVDLASTTGAEVNLEVVTACADDVATFKIVNRGSAWPRTGTLRIFRVADGGLKPLSSRKMRFAKGQKASFRMKKPGSDTVAIFIEPSWYERPFKFDAQVACN